MTNEQKLSIVEVKYISIILFNFNCWPSEARPTSVLQQMAHQLLEICIHDNPKKSNRFCPTKEKLKVLLQYIDIHYRGIACKYTKKVTDFVRQKRER